MGFDHDDDWANSFRGLGLHWGRFLILLLFDVACALSFPKGDLRHLQKVTCFRRGRLAMHLEANGLWIIVLADRMGG